MPYYLIELWIQQTVLIILFTTILIYTILLRLKNYIYNFIYIYIIIYKIIFIYHHQHLINMKYIFFYKCYTLQQRPMCTGMNLIIQDHTLIITPIVRQLVGLDCREIMTKRPYIEIFSLYGSNSSPSTTSASVAKRHLLCSSMDIWCLTTCLLTLFALINILSWILSIF